MFFKNSFKFLIKNENRVICYYVIFIPIYITLGMKYNYKYDCTVYGYLHHISKQISYLDHFPYWTSKLRYLDQILEKKKITRVIASHYLGYIRATLITEITIVETIKLLDMEDQKFSKTNDQLEQFLESDP